MQQIEGENELFLFQTFSDKRSQFLTQIHTYLNYLTPGKSLFGQYIETVRGIVEIDKRKLIIKNRTLTKTSKTIFRRSV